MPAPLNRSQFKRLAGREQKSCPSCSVAAGKPVFHPLEAFGYRTVRGRVQLQTWCRACRGKKGA